MSKHRPSRIFNSPGLISLLLAGACLAAPGPATAETAAASNPGSYFLDLTEASLLSTIASEESAGRDLVDIEASWDGSQTRFAAVFQPLPGTVHALLQATPAAWQDWLGQMNLLGGRYLDFEVGYLDGVKRYCGLFVEDGNDVPMPIHSTNTDTAFQNLLEQYFEQGYSLVDFESYIEPGGAPRYAGMWAKNNKTPMTHLFYGLTYDELSDLLAPLAGRPVDLERYWSPLHGQFRYALLLAQIGNDNHGWALYRNQTEASLASNHGTHADADTFLIDLDVRDTVTPHQYHAIWGKARAARATAPPYLQSAEVEPLPPALANEIASFGIGGEIGLEARNLRTNQTFVYDAERPFYLASVAKTAMHVRLWQHFQSDPTFRDEQSPYTESADSRAPWFVDERNTGLDVCTSKTAIQCFFSPGSPGFNACHFGQSFPLSRFDEAMMQVSDNAATSMLVDDDTVGLAHDATNLNEWLSGIPGVGRGVGLLTSIHDVDRTLRWQGQVGAPPAETSYFLVPPWAFEPLHRCGDDRWGDLASYLGLGPGDPFPTYDEIQGHLRYYRMGLNSATPRAWTRFLELFHEEAFLSESKTEEAIAMMTEGSRLASDPAFPGHVVVRGKGGSKGDSNDGTRTISEGSFFELGPDTIAVSVFSNYGSWNADSVRTRFGDIGLEILRGLSANLVECQAGSRGFVPSAAAPGDPFSVWCAVTNEGGGDATAFDVTFRLSTDTNITAADPVIGTVRVPGIPGGESRLATLGTTLPAGLQAGTYHVAWEIDHRLTDAWGEVGELSESHARHVGYATEDTLTVTLPAPIFADGFESGTTGAWSP